jgi:branched-chain amino acid transport system substrate-binding protein
MKYKIFGIFFLIFILFSCAKQPEIIKHYEKEKPEKKETVTEIKKPDVSKPKKEFKPDPFESEKQIVRQEKITICCLFAMSGKYKTIGSKALKGIELAVSEFNQSSEDIFINILIKDTASDPNTAAKIVKELASFNKTTSDTKIAAIIGPIMNAAIPAIEAQNAKIPIITLSQKDKITKIGDYVFRNFLTPKAQVETIASYSVDVMKIKNFAILYPDEKYGEIFMNLFWDELIARGARVTGIEKYNPSNTDFAESIKKLVGLYYELEEDEGNIFNEIKGIEAIQEITLPEEIEEIEESEADEDELEEESDTAEDEEIEEERQAVVDFEAIFIPDAPSKAGLILPQLAFHDATDLYVFGTNLWNSDELIKLSDGYAHHAMMPDIFFKASKAPHVVNFNKNFKKIFNEEPEIIEASAYDNAMMIFEAVKRAKKNSSYIREELLSLENYHGITGDTCFDKTGDAKKKLYLLQIKNRRFYEVMH